MADSLASSGSDQSWDPHIDAFEILRAKITGITHTMQEFHVHELLNNQHSMPTLAHLKSIDTTLSGPIDMSPRTSESTSTTTSTSTRSTSILSSNSSSSNSSTNSNSNNQTDKTLPTSLSNLFLTTNTLIHSRLDELHQTSIDDSYNNDYNPNSLAATWRSDFLQLMSNCIGQSERLESISTELLGMEGKTRALVSLEQAIAAEFEQREKKYEERLRECELASEQQQMMIESLEDLVADLELKIENPHVPIVISESLDTRLLKHRRKRHSSNADTDLCRWGFRKKVVDILDIETKIDWVHKARWEVAMVLGGGVGTGHVIHTFEGRLHGIEMIIAGSGLTGQPEEVRTSILIRCWY
ncbi:hypothetical protein CLU79DRAFT_707963 [Phycomyces nitens]|nr:hypothetical protein CLU79DRAFT_707963 [Phycomyces nitens]